MIFTKINEFQPTGNQVTADGIKHRVPAKATHFHSDSDGVGARLGLEAGIQNGVSPDLFPDYINTMNSYYGMRDTIQFAKCLYKKRQSEYIREIADHGLRGAGERYPFMAQIQASFGNHYIGDLTAYTGLAAQEANAEAGSEAYHKARQVAFGEPPTLKVAAHEAAHAVQGVTSDQLEGSVLLKVFFVIPWGSIKHFFKGTTKIRHIIQPPGKGNF